MENLLLLKNGNEKEKFESYILHLFRFQLNLNPQFYTSSLYYIIKKKNHRLLREILSCNNGKPKYPQIDIAKISRAIYEANNKLSSKQKQIINQFLYSLSPEYLQEQVIKYPSPPNSEIKNKIKNEGLKHIIDICHPHPKKFKAPWLPITIMRDLQPPQGTLLQRFRSIRKANKEEIIALIKQYPYLWHYIYTRVQHRPSIVNDALNTMFESASTRMILSNIDLLNPGSMFTPTPALFEKIKQRLENEKSFIHSSLAFEKYFQAPSQIQDSLLSLIDKNIEKINVIINEPIVLITDISGSLIYKKINKEDIRAKISLFIAYMFSRKLQNNKFYSLLYNHTLTPYVPANSIKTLINQISNIKIFGGSLPHKAIDFLINQNINPETIIIVSDFDESKCKDENCNCGGKYHFRSSLENFLHKFGAKKFFLLKVSGSERENMLKYAFNPLKEQNKLDYEIIQISNISDIEQALASMFLVSNQFSQIIADYAQILSDSQTKTDTQYKTENRNTYAGNCSICLLPIFREHIKCTICGSVFHSFHADTFKQCPICKDYLPTASPRLL